MRSGLHFHDSKILTGHLYSHEIRVDVQWSSYENWT